MTGGAENVGVEISAQKHEKMQELKMQRTRYGSNVTFFAVMLNTCVRNRRCSGANNASRIMTRTK